MGFVPNVITSNYQCFTTAAKEHLCSPAVKLKENINTLSSFLQ